MEALSNLSNALAETVESGDQTVARVEARRRLPASGIVWSPDGVIVTAHHIVKRDEGIRIGLPDGKVVPAKLIGRDRSTDLAVLRAEADGLTAPVWAEDADLSVGHLVLALGRPGERVMATLGIISALKDNWRTPAGGQIDRYLQTDVVMYPGFSGGLLMSAEGKGLGLNTSALLRGVYHRLNCCRYRGISGDTGNVVWAAVAWNMKKVTFLHAEKEERRTWRRIRLGA